MSIWQTKSWQDMLKKSWQVEKTIILEDIFIEKRKIWLWEYWLFVLWFDRIISSEKLEELKEICKKEKALFLQLESIDYSWNNNYFLEDYKNLEKKYYKKFITSNTAIIDLYKSEDNILTEMKQKGRYNIRLAEKKWIKIFEAEKTEKNIKIFYNLMLETTSRDNFSWNTLNYYNIFLKNIPFSKLLFAEYNWNIIAAWIFIYNEEIAIYYYWASTSDKKFRNLMAPYLLQWEAIKIWKSLGCKIYDFLGIAENLDKKSSLAWVTDFKLKFTKTWIKVSESFIFINKKLKYFFINILRNLKNIF